MTSGAGTESGAATEPSLREEVRSTPALRVQDQEFLVADGIVKWFGSRQTALDGVSCSVAPGEVVAIRGRSGSGKSTLLLCLAGITRPDEGEVRYFGKSISDVKDAELARLRRSKFGFVFQFGFLLPDLTGKDNVALPLLLNGVGRREADTAALTQLRDLDCEHLADKRHAQMSGGEGQRVALARALVTQPLAIFADEPTGSLDFANGELVMRRLTDAARERGAAVLVVTHDRHVASFCDREICLQDGRLVGASQS